MDITILPAFFHSPYREEFKNLFSLNSVSNERKEEIIRAHLPAIRSLCAHLARFMGVDPDTLISIKIDHDQPEERAALKMWKKFPRRALMIHSTMIYNLLHVFHYRVSHIEVHAEILDRAILIAVHPEMAEADESATEPLTTSSSTWSLVSIESSRPRRSRSRRFSFDGSRSSSISSLTSFSSLESLLATPVKAPVLASQSSTPTRSPSARSMRSLTPSQSMRPPICISVDDVEIPNVEDIQEKFAILKRTPWKDCTSKLVIENKEERLRQITLEELPPLPPVQLDDGFTEMALTPAADEPSLEQLKEISGGLFDDYVPRVSVEEVVKEARKRKHPAQLKFFNKFYEWKTKHGRIQWLEEEMAVDFENPPVEPVYPQSFLSMANLSDDEETFDRHKERPFLRIIELPAEQPFPDPVEVERVIAQINTEDPSAQKHRHMKDKTKTSCDNQGRLFWGDEIAASSSPIPTSSKGKEPQKKLTTLVSISPICPVDRVRKTKVDTSSQTEREEPQPNETASGAADQASAEPAIIRPANVPFQVYVEEEEDLPPARPNRQSYHPGLEILLGTPDPDHPSVRVPQRNPLADIVDEPVRRRRRQANQESMFISTLTRRTYGSLRHTYESFRGNFDSGSKLKNRQFDTSIFTQRNEQQILELREVAGYIIRQEFLSDEDEEDQGWRFQHVLEPPRSGWPLAEDDILDNDWLRFSWRDHFQWRQFTDKQHEIRPDPVLPENFRYDRAPLVSDMVRMTYPNWDDAHYNIQDLLAPLPPPEELYQQDQAGGAGRVGQSTSREPTPARVTGEFQTPSLRIAHSHSSKDTLKSFGSSILAPPSSVSSGTEIVKSIGSSGLGLAPVEEEQEVTAGPSGEGAQPALPSGSAPDVWWLNPATEQPAQDPHEPATEQPAQAVSAPETVQPAQGPPGDHQVQVQPEPPLPEAGRAKDFVFAVPEVPRRSTRARDPVNYREPVEDRPRRKRRRRKRNPNANQGDAAQVPQEVPQVQEPPQYDQPADLPPADVPAPQADVPAPEADVPAPEADVPAPETDVPAPETDVPAPKTDVPAPETDVPAPEADVPPFVLDVPAAVDERRCTPTMVENYLRRVMLQMGRNTITFAECCPPEECSKEYAASFFFCLLNLAWRGLVRVSNIPEDPKTSDPSTVVIEGLAPLFNDYK